MGLIHNYAPPDLAAALDFLASAGQTFPFADLVTRTFHFDDIEEAFAFAHRNSGGRVAVTP